MSDKYAALRASIGAVVEKAKAAQEAAEKTSVARREALERAHRMYQQEKERAEAAEGRILALLAEREADKARIAELTDALKHSVAGYKSCLRMGHDRIIDLGGDCDSPEVMIAGNPDIREAEKLLAAGITLETGV